jgi:hypothetical protein
MVNGLLAVKAAVGAHATSSRYHQHSVDLRCPKCGCKGVVVWEGHGADKTLVWLSGQFYERLAKRSPFPIELVCMKCGAAQVE